MPKRARTPKSSRRDGSTRKRIRPNSALNGEAVIYRPLRENEMRLMRIDYTKANQSIIHCELEIFNSKEWPHYKALSYCWGDQPASYKILLNGQPFLIRPNLQLFLDLMKSEHQTCWIFIDALCINQADLVERSIQVGMMGGIYQNAAEVVVWLGSEIGPSFAEESRLKKIEDRMVESALSRLEAMENLISFSAIATLDYWSRVWILQEVMLAETLTFRFQNLAISKDETQWLVEYVARFRTRTGPDAKIKTSYLNTQPIGDLKIWELNNRPIAAQVLDLSANHELTDSDEEQSLWRSRTLLPVINRYAVHCCSEPIDKIFGLLGLVTCQLKADYTMPKLEMFLRAFAEGLLESDEISSLSHLVIKDRDYFKKRKAHAERPYCEAGAENATYYRHESHMVRELSRIGSWSGKEELSYCRNLLSALQLGPCHPVVLLILRATIHTCAMLRAGQACLIRRYEERFFMHLAIESTENDKLKRIVARLRMAATIKRLEAPLPSQTLFGSPCDGNDVRSVVEWISFAVTIFVGLLDRRSRFLKGMVKTRLDMLMTSLYELEEDSEVLDKDAWSRIVDLANTFIKDYRRLSLLDGTEWLRLQTEISKAVRFVRQVQELVEARNADGNNTQGDYDRAINHSSLFEEEETLMTIDVVPLRLD